MPITLYCGCRVVDVKNRGWAFVIRLTPKYTWSMFTSPFDERIGFIVLNVSDLAKHKSSDVELSIIHSWSSEKQKNQFLLGRAAAHLAIKTIGGDYTLPILRAESHEPIWPEGFTGSISHCNDWAIAAVSTIKDYISIGIDIQVATKDISLVTRRVCLAEELSWIEQNTEDKNKRAAMVFSAKETIYKALFPIYKKFLAFKDVKLIWNDESKCFNGSIVNQNLNISGKHSLLKIGCTFKGRYLMTFLALDRN